MENHLDLKLAQKAPKRENVFEVLKKYYQNNYTLEKDFLITQILARYEKVKTSGLFYLLKLPFAIFKTKGIAHKMFGKNPR